MSTVDVINDEVHFRGYLVALLVQSGVPATVIGEFEDHLKAGTLFEEDEHQCSECSECNAEAVIPHLHDCRFYEPPAKGAKAGERREKVEESVYDCAMDDVLRSVKPFAKGGLIKWADLERIIGQLREEGEIE